MKNIVICADGTGNTTITSRGTNVFKLYGAVDQTGHRVTPGLTPQVALYHDGVGTESPIRGFIMGAVERNSTWRQVALNVADTVVSSKWIGLALKTLWHHPWLIAWVVVTLWLALAVDGRLDRMYSQFWHHDYMRPKLRKVLGLG